MSTIAAVIGRILIAIIFIGSGANKLMEQALTEGMITKVGLPAGLAVPTGIFELVAGLCLVFGIMTRLASVLLAGFTFLTIIFFHNNFSDPTQTIMALKNVALIGGLLLVFAHSQIWYGWDSMRKERKHEIAVNEAEARVHDAELRAARAEGAAEAAHEPVVVHTAPVAPVTTVVTPAPGVNPDTRAL